MSRNPLPRDHHTLNLGYSHHFSPFSPVIYLPNRVLERPEGTMMWLRILFTWRPAFGSILQSHYLPLPPLPRQGHPIFILANFTAHEHIDFTFHSPTRHCSFSIYVDISIEDSHLLLSTQAIKRSNDNTNLLIVLTVSSLMSGSSAGFTATRQKSSNWASSKIKNTMDVLLFKI